LQEKLKTFEGLLKDFEDRKEHIHVIVAQTTKGFGKYILSLCAIATTLI